VRLPHPEILNTLSVGDTLLLDDGKLRMVVTAKHDGAVDTVVEVRPTLTHWNHWQETVE
jgi:pyruvate kinase